MFHYRFCFKEQMTRGLSPPSHVQETRLYIWGGAFFLLLLFVGLVLFFYSLVTEVDVVAHSGLLWTTRQSPGRSQRKGEGGDAG